MAGMRILLLLILCLTQSTVFATHLVGGEIYYDCLGNDRYKITLKVYRDCGPTNTLHTDFDTRAALGIYGSNRELIQKHYLILPAGDKNVPIDVGNPCMVTPPDICIEVAEYTKEITLPFREGGYTMVYQRCCRNPQIVNLTVPKDQGATYFVHISEEALLSCNSSPRFEDFPAVVLCKDQPFFKEHKASDPDGDDLVFRFSKLYHGATPFNPMVDPPTAPPYQELNWVAGYGPETPLSGTPGVEINPTNGDLSGTPDKEGIFVIGFLVQEYRNGTLMSEVYRDFQIIVSECEQTVFAGIENQIDQPGFSHFCKGLTVDYGNLSLNGEDFFWDFGDPSTLADTSTLSNPTYTYSDTGTYEVTLIANPSWPCADTATTIYTLYDELAPNFPPQDPMCIVDNFFLIPAGGLFSSSAEFEWEFGENSSASSTTDQIVGVSFNEPGHHLVSLTVTENNCVETYQDIITVFDRPQIDFILGEHGDCSPVTVQFFDLSSAMADITYNWDFGDGNTSNEASPSHTYEIPGTYDVSLTISTDSICVDTKSKSLPDAVTVYPSPISELIVSPEEQTIWEAHFDVENLSTAIDSFQIDMNNGDTIYERDFTYTYADTGTYEIQQTVWNEYGCPDTSRAMVTVTPVYVFYAPNAFTPDGDAINEIWKPEVEYPSSYELYVFDRWGHVIFETTDPETGWNGRIRGKRAPVGVYVYLAIVKDEKLRKHTYRGHITLVR